MCTALSRWNIQFGWQKALDISNVTLYGQTLTVIVTERGYVSTILGAPHGYTLICGIYHDDYTKCCDENI